MGKGRFGAALVDQHIAVEGGLPACKDRDLRRRCGLGARAAQTGADAGHHLGRIEGLDDVVIGAQFQPRHPVLHLCAARDDDDRRPRFERQPMHQRQTVAVGQAKVHQTDIGLAAFQPGLEFRRAGIGAGAEPGLLQSIDQHAADFGFVVQHGDKRGLGGSHRRTPAISAASSAATKGFCKTGQGAAARSRLPGGSEVINSIGTRPDR